MLSNIFPETEYNKLQYDDEGLYSVTHYIQADQISSLLKNNFINNHNINILDGTSGIGGNTISFCKYFKNVTALEINKERYNKLVNNINQYNLNNITTINHDCIDYLYKNYMNYNIYFFDPPWGGPLYKTLTDIRLNLGSKTLYDIALYLKKNKIKDKILAFKLPFNYDFNEFNEFNYKLYKIKNYYIIVILY
jgi:16S rRNA G966 N2-methylase RsmD